MAYNVLFEYNSKFICFFISTILCCKNRLIIKNFMFTIFKKLMLKLKNMGLKGYEEIRSSTHL